MVSEEPSENMVMSSSLGKEDQRRRGGGAFIGVQNGFKRRRGKHAFRGTCSPRVIRVSVRQTDVTQSLSNEL